MLYKHQTFIAFQLKLATDCSKYSEINHLCFLPLNLLNLQTEFAASCFALDELQFSCGKCLLLPMQACTSASPVAYLRFLNSPNTAGWPQLIRNVLLRDYSTFITLRAQCPYTPGLCLDGLVSVSSSGCHLKEHPQAATELLENWWELLHGAAPVWLQCICFICCFRHILFQWSERQLSDNCSYPHFKIKKSTLWLSQLPWEPRLCQQA